MWGDDTIITQAPGSRRTPGEGIGSLEGAKGNGDLLPEHPDMATPGDMPPITAVLPQMCIPVFTGLTSRMAAAIGLQVRSYEARRRGILFSLLSRISVTVTPQTAKVRESSAQCRLVESILLARNRDQIEVGMVYNDRDDRGWVHR
jgi:hypothetical protein